MFTERIVLAAGVVAMLAFTSTAPTQVAEESESEKSNKPCCFNNSAYSGTCKVQPAEDETCKSILAYLNNPMAHGKNYCGSTKVRQGWTEVKCEEEES